MNPKIYNEEWKSPDYLKFRQIKMERWDEIWLKYFNPSKSKLKRLILKHQPKNVYASVSQYLYFKEHNTYKNRLLFSNYLAEFDDVDEKIVDECDEYIKREYGLKLLRKIQSSSRGFHLIYDSIKGNFEEHILFKKILTDDLEKKFPIDSLVCRDIFRVSRMDGTLNGNKLCLSHSLGNSCKGVMTNGEALKQLYFPPSEERGRTDIKTTLPTHYYYNFISNSVCGCNNLYVPLIKWQYMRKRLLRKTIKKYDLGSFLAIKTLKSIYFLFFKCCNDKRITKIYNYAKSNSLFEFQKYRWNWIPIKGEYNFPIEMAYFEGRNGNGWYSNPHLEFFGLKTQNKACGMGNLKVYWAERAKKGVDFG